MALIDTQTNRIDLRLVAEMVTPGSRVLDVGCGDG
ncbi:methionine biosynthesis protein MetW, partial [Bosea sp. (in: a-proteobacteria)]